MNIEKNCQIKQSVFVPILKYLAIVLKNNQPTDVFIVIVIDTGEDENVVTDGRWSEGRDNEGDVNHGDQADLPPGITTQYGAIMWTIWTFPPLYHHFDVQQWVKVNQNLF